MFQSRHWVPLALGFGLPLVTISCACRIDSFKVVQPPTLHSIEREYFLTPSRLTDLAKGDFSYSRTIADPSRGTAAPYLTARLLADSETELRLLVAPGPEPRDWMFDTLYSGPKGGQPVAYYDSDITDVDGAGVVYSRGRVFTVRAQEHVFLDLEPAKDIILRSALRTPTGMLPVVFSRGSRPTLLMHRYSQTQRRWLPAQPLACDLGVFSFGSIVSIGNQLVLPCLPGLGIYNAETGGFAQLTFPGLSGEVRMLRAHPSPNGREAVLTVVVAGSDRPLHHFHFVDGQLRTITAWSGLQINDIEWRRDGRMLIATSEYVAEAGGAGQALRMVLARPSCMLHSAADLSYSHAICGPRNDDTDASRFKNGATIGSIYQTLDFGASWRDITAALGF